MFNKSPNFNKVYPRLVMQLADQGIVKHSRNGKVVSTQSTLNLRNPRERCVLGVRRNINPFFLLAESMWIFLGKNDVATLSHFNSRIADYSDNGNAFHAAYGHRLRANGSDQLKTALSMLMAQPDSRRVVLQIWDKDLDLGTDTLDIPCNDMLFLKIVNGKLKMTVINRSNDIHWGLPTNQFQFSMLSEFLAPCLCVEIGTQTHFSDDTHGYVETRPWNNYMEALQAGDETHHIDIYDIFKPTKLSDCLFLDFFKRFQDGEPYWNALERLSLLTDHVTIYWDDMENFLQQLEGKHNYSANDFVRESKKSSRGIKYLDAIFELLYLYLWFKTVDRSNRSTDLLRLEAIEFITESIKSDDICIDFKMSALNFMVSGLVEPDLEKPFIKELLDHFSDSKNCGFDVERISLLEPFLNQIGKL